MTALKSQRNEKKNKRETNDDKRTHLLLFNKQSMEFEREYQSIETPV